MPSVDDISLMVAAAAEQARQLTAQIAAARTALGELTATLASMNVEGSAAAAGGISEDAETLTSDAAGMIESLEQVQRRLDALRGLLSGAGVAVAKTGTAKVVSATLDPAPYLGDMPAMRPKRELRRGEVQDKTHGRRVGSTDDQKWVSGEGDRYARRVQERWEREKPGGPAQMKRFPVAGHVEVKFAEYMRERGLTYERLVINNPDGPCPLPLGCERFLPWVLGPKRSLTVVYPGGTRTFVGTGTIA